MRTLPETGWRYFVVTPIASITGSASKALLLFGVTAAVAIALGGRGDPLAGAAPDRRADPAPGGHGARVRRRRTGVRATVDRTDDIGDLGQAFNAMADYITNSHRDLTKGAAGAAAPQRRAGRCQPNEIQLPRQHEPRTAHALERHHRVRGDPAPSDVRAARNDRYVGYVDDIQRSGQHCCR